MKEYSKISIFFNLDATVIANFWRWTSPKFSRSAAKWEYYPVII